MLHTGEQAQPHDARPRGRALPGHRPSEQKNANGRALARAAGAIPCRRSAAISPRRCSHEIVVVVAAPTAATPADAVPFPVVIDALARRDRDLGLGAPLLLPLVLVAVGLDLVFEITLTKLARSLASSVAIFSVASLISCFSAARCPFFASYTDAARYNMARIPCLPTAERTSVGKGLIF